MLSLLVLYGRFEKLGRFIIGREELLDNWIRFFIETYFELMIASVIGIGFYRLKSGVADEWTWTTNCVMLGLVVIFPVLIFIFTIRLVIGKTNRGRMHLYIGVIMEGLNTFGIGAPFSTLILILRRILFFSAVLFLQKAPLAQIYLYMASSYLKTVFIVGVKPNQARSDNYLEFYNEWSITLIAYL